MRSPAASAGGPSPLHGTAGTLRYQPALDGVRALAVTAVLLFHGGVAFLPGGFLGVDAFFVLSGFLITSLLLAEHARNGRIALAAFWGRRARRLLPALLVLLVAVAAVERTVLPPVELRLLRWDALAALGYLANWRMVDRGTGYFVDTAAPSPLQHTWSLGIEEQFYLLWPVLVVALLAIRPVSRSRAAMLAVCAGGVVASAVVATAFYRAGDIDRAYFGTDARAQALLVGCALAVVLRRPAVVDPDRDAGAVTARAASWQPRWALALGALGAAVGTGWLWTHAHGTSPWLYQGGLALAALAVGLVLTQVQLQPNALLPRVLSLSPLVWLGKISYGVYLWHWPVFQFVTADRSNLGGTALLGARLGLTLFIATISYLVVECRSARPLGRGGLDGSECPGCWSECRCPACHCPRYGCPACLRYGCPAYLRYGCLNCLDRVGARHWPRRRWLDSWPSRRARSRRSRCRPVSRRPSRS